MFSRIISAIAFYREDGTILIQDRRNIIKDDIEWGFFGGGREDHETPPQTALREVCEELNIQLEEKDLEEAGFFIEEQTGIVRYETTLFMTPWKNEYERDFQVLEWSGSEWVTPKEMKPRHIYPIMHVFLGAVEQFMKDRWITQTTNSI